MKTLFHSTIFIAVFFFAFQDLIAQQTKLVWADEIIFREEMKNEGLSDAVIDKLVEQHKQMLSEGRTFSYSSYSSNQKTNPNPVPYAVCGDMGVENGWGAWQAKDGKNIQGGSLSMLASSAAAPRFNLTSGTGVDACTPGPAPGAPKIPVVCPGFGNASIQLGEKNKNGIQGGCCNGPTAGCAEQLIYPLTVTAQDTNFVYAYAIVIENPNNGHLISEAPFAEIYILDQNGDTVKCSHHKYMGNTVDTTILPGMYRGACASTYISSWKDITYKPWTIEGINLSKYIGQNLTVVITNADCQQGGHFCHSYWDFSCGVIQGAATASCAGGQVNTLTAPASDPSNPYTYIWTHQGTVIGNTQVITPIVNPGDTFIVEVQQASGCPFHLVYVPQTSAVTPAFISSGNCSAMSFTDMTTSNAQNPVASWNWSFPGGSPASSTSQNPGPVIFSPGTYTVTLSVTTSTGCTGTIQQVFTFGAPPQATMSNTSSCIGGNSATATVNVNGGSSPYTYSWAPIAGNTPTLTGLASGTYSVIVTDANGCSVSVSQTISSAGGPTAAFNSGPFCMGGIMMLSDGSVSPGNDPIVLWNWTMPGGNPSTSSNINASTQYPSAGTHTVTLIVTTQAGCKDTIEQQVLVYRKPIALFDDKDSGCAPVCHQFTDLSQCADGTITSWSWSFPGGSSSASSVQNPNICYSNPGTYNASLIVTSSYGCSDTISFQQIINVYAWPSAGFSVAPPKASANDPVFNFSEGWSNDVVKWAWNFGDGDTDNVSMNPVHSYSATVGSNDFYSYNVCIRAENQHGCWDTACHKVEILPEFTFYIPNTFTPNGDNMNEFFYGKGRGIKEYSIWIFDRWGNQIWDCHHEGENAEWDKNKSEGMSSACQWDGKVVGGGVDMNGRSGELAQQDVYVWKVKLTDIFDRPHDYMGNVNIVR